MKKNIDFLKKAIDAYYSGKPIISDSEYDELYSELKKQFPHDKFFIQVGTNVETNKVKLSTRRGSLVKTNPESAIDWIKEHKKESFIITPKYDGLSITLDYDKNGKFIRATTRGNGSVGEDVSDRAKFFKGFKSKINPKAGITSVTGEAVISKQDFEKYSEKFAMARNLCVGKLKAKLTAAQYQSKAKPEDWQVLKDITFMTYTSNLQSKSKTLDYLKRLGFITAKQLYAGKDITSELLSDLLKTRDEDFDCDGIVIDIDSKTCQNDYGFESDDITPAYAIAVKPTKAEQDSAEAVIDFIDWQMNRTGNLIPVAKLQTPVVLKGATIKSISLANYDRCKAEGFGTGATVRVVRSGDVIPYVDIMKPVKFTVSGKCPICGEKLVKRGVHLHCKNTKCPGRRLASLQNFFLKLKVEDISYETLAQLYRAGYTKIPQILNITKQQLLSLDKFADIKANKFLEQMKKIKDCKLVDFMVACGCFNDGITGLGRAILQVVVDSLGEKVCTGISESDLQGLEHFGRGRIKLYMQCQDKWLKKYNALSKYFNIQMKEEKKIGKLTGKIFCWTGFRDKVLKEWIEDNGGIMKDGLTKDVNVLFSAGPSAKTTKAKQRGIEIVSQGAAQSYIKNLLDMS